MGIKTFRPRSPGRRAATGYDFSEITKDTPEKSLLTSNHRVKGRSNTGQISIRWKGGGHKRRFRIIDFKRDKFDVPATVASIEYDPNRTCRIALLHYTDGEKRYIVAPIGLNVGQMVQSGAESDILPGNCLPLKNIPLGTLVHNIELQPNKGGQMVRSAGASAQVMAKEGNYVTLRLPSGEMRMVRATCRATIGEVGNSDHENESI